MSSVNTNKTNNKYKQLPPKNKANKIKRGQIRSKTGQLRPFWPKEANNKAKKAHMDRRPSKISSKVPENE
jgi:hypothetical protein